MALQGAAVQAASALRRARAVVVTAGAGMGVDSGLPDFRGTEGLWKAYPPLAKLGLNFSDMANPEWFETDPCFAWGFYGHRLLLYRRTLPHEGFQLLRTWGAQTPHGCFVFTSNVDGQFQRAGFAEEQILECHGSIHFLQSLTGGPIFPADAVKLPEINPATLRVPESELPRCADGSLARPNILMFGDWGWDSKRTDAQRRRFTEWLGRLRREPEPGSEEDVGGPVVVELGAGEAVPTVRRTSETLVRELGGTLVRINPRDSHMPRGLGISMPCGALEGLELIAAALAHA
eukprot:TRINITY_DN90926_c0_g1_i1.p1 TRINITY_DN90926_c0_g1~~TRINITY_DN90926_c0_g1_i1.p1  ORF type:complete len:311 (-),score=51.54 TRINITY_DN90926_c0_g1_i1:22-891(-)